MSVVLCLTLEVLLLEIKGSEHSLQEFLVILQVCLSGMHRPCMTMYQGMQDLNTKAELRAAQMQRQNGIVNRAAAAITNAAEAAVRQI